MLSMSRFSNLIDERDRVRRDIEIEVERLQSLRVRLATLECVLEFAQPDSPVATDLTPFLKKAA